MTDKVSNDKDSKINMSTALQTLKIYINQCLKSPFLFFISIFLCIIATFTNPFLSNFILSDIIERITNGSIPSGEYFSVLTPSIIAYILCQFINGAILWRLAVLAIWELQVKGWKQLREKCFNALIHQSSNFHNSKFSGSLVSAANKFSYGSFGNITDIFVFDILSLFASFVFMGIILGPRVPLLTAVLLLISLLFILAVGLSMGKLRYIAENEANEDNTTSGYLADSVSNIMAVKSYANEENEEIRFSKQTKINAIAGRKTMFAFEWSEFKYSVIWSLLLSALIIGIVAYKQYFDISIGTMVLAVTYTTTMARMLWESTRIFRMINRSLGDAQPMTEILNAENTITDSKDAKPLIVSNARVNFNNVEFSYKKADTVFENLNIEIEPGTSVGIVGHSGSGKTTLTKLLLRFIDIQNGSITIDNQDIKNVTQQSLHQAISYVPQEPLLFHRTIFENIAYGKPNASQEEVEEAAKKANAYDFIINLPAGFNTLTGERGVKLSGGQRQRIIIARAILKNSPILILDEATSALDTESEQYIHQAIGKMMIDKTSIVIAHRLSTVSSLNRIIVLENGKIVQDGTHKSLTKEKGVYATLWNKQTGFLLE